MQERYRKESYNYIGGVSMKKRKLSITISFLSITLVTILSGYLYVAYSDPLKSYGMVFYNDEYKHIVLLN